MADNFIASVTVAGSIATISWEYPVGTSANDFSCILVLTKYTDITNWTEYETTSYNRREQNYQINMAGPQASIFNLLCIRNTGKVYDCFIAGEYLPIAKLTAPILSTIFNGSIDNINNAYNIKVIVDSIYVTTTAYDIMCIIQFDSDADSITNVFNNTTFTAEEIANGKIFLLTGLIADRVANVYCICRNNTTNAISYPSNSLAFTPTLSPYIEHPVTFTYHKETGSATLTSYIAAWGVNTTTEHTVIWLMYNANGVGTIIATTSLDTEVQQTTAELIISAGTVSSLNGITFALDTLYTIGMVARNGHGESVGYKSGFLGAQNVYLVKEQLPLTLSLSSMTDAFNYGDVTTDISATIDLGNDLGFSSSTSLFAQMQLINKNVSSGPPTPGNPVSIAIAQALATGLFNSTHKSNMFQLAIASVSNASIDVASSALLVAFNALGAANTAASLAAADLATADAGALANAIIADSAAISAASAADAVYKFTGYIIDSNLSLANTISATDGIVNAASNNANSFTPGISTHYYISSKTILLLDSKDIIMHNQYELTGKRVQYNVNNNTLFGQTSNICHLFAGSRAEAPTITISTEASAIAGVAFITISPNNMGDFPFNKWNIYRSTDDGVSWTLIDSTTNLTYTDINLLSNTTYKYKVQSVTNSVAMNDVSNTLVDGQISTIKDITTFSTPLNKTTVNVTDITSDKAKLHIGNPNTTALTGLTLVSDDYYVKCKIWKGTETKPTIFTHTSNTLTLDLTGLADPDPLIRKIFNVEAVIAYKDPNSSDPAARVYSLESSILQFETIFDTIPSAFGATNISVTKSLNTDIPIVSWSRPAATVATESGAQISFSNYTISCRNSQTSEVVSFDDITDITTTTLSLTGLQAGHSYYCHIETFYDDTFLSGIQELAPPPLISNIFYHFVEQSTIDDPVLTIGVTPHSQIIATWSIPIDSNLSNAYSNVSSFELQLSKASNWYKTVSALPSAQTYAFDNLDVNFEYTCKIKMITMSTLNNSIVTSGLSGVSNAISTYNMPGDISSLSCVANETSIIYSWNTSANSSAYQYFTLSNNIWTTISNTTLTLSNLPSGIEFVLSVRAVRQDPNNNSVVILGTSADITATPYGVPIVNYTVECGQDKTVIVDMLDNVALHGGAFKNYTLDIQSVELLQGVPKFSESIILTLAELTVSSNYYYTNSNLINGKEYTVAVQVSTTDPSKNGPTKTSANAQLTVIPYNKIIPTPITTTVKVLSETSMSLSFPKLDTVALGVSSDTFVSIAATVNGVARAVVDSKTGNILLYNDEWTYTLTGGVLGNSVSFAIIYHANSPNEPGVPTHPVNSETFITSNVILYGTPIINNVSIKSLDEAISATCNSINLKFKVFDKVIMNVYSDSFATNLLYTTSTTAHNLNNVFSTKIEQLVNNTEYFAQIIFISGEPSNNSVTSEIKSAVYSVTPKSTKRPVITSVTLNENNNTLSVMVTTFNTEMVGCFITLNSSRTEDYIQDSTTVLEYQTAEHILNDNSNAAVYIFDTTNVALSAIYSVQAIVSNSNGMGKYNKVKSSSVNGIATF